MFLRSAIFALLALRRPRPEPAISTKRCASSRVRSAAAPTSSRVDRAEAHERLGHQVIVENKPAPAAIWGPSSRQIGARRLHLLLVAGSYT